MVSRHRGEGRGGTAIGEREGGEGSAVVRWGEGGVGLRELGVGRAVRDGRGRCAPLSERGLLLKLMLRSVLLP